MLETLLPARESAVEPPKRWRNHYWLHRRISVDGEPEGPGRYVSKYVWPSRDVAESIAERRRADLDAAGAEYLGAVPEPAS